MERRMAQAVIAASSSHGCLASSSSSVAANLQTSRLLSSQACNLSVSVSQVARCSRPQRARIVKSSYQDELPVLQEKVRPLQPAELNLPLEMTPTSHETLHSGKGLTASQMLGHGNPQQMKEALQAAKKKYGKPTVSEALQEAKKHLGKDGLGKLALFGGVASVGVFLSGAVLTSLELLPLAPEALQTVGVAYSVLLASRLLQGKPAEFAVSPIKAVIELVDSGNVNKVQRTSLVLPQDLDPTVVTAMEKLAEERDLAVNQVEEMKRRALEYARIVTEKQALETVALQLAEERDVAMSEVTALKSAVETMTTRMAGIEQMLEREVGQLKVQNEALETVTLQLAQERDSALQEIAKLQEVVKSQARSEAEKHALEEIALQLAQERDNALFELKNLKQMVPNLGPPAMEQDPFIEARVQGVQSHLLGEDVQKDEAEYTFAHIVEDKVHLPPELENLERVVPNLGTEGGPAIKQDPFLEARVQDIRSQFLEEHIQGNKAENALAHIVKDYEVHPPPAAP